MNPQTLMGSKRSCIGYQICWTSSQLISSRKKIIGVTKKNTDSSTALEFYLPDAQRIKVKSTRFKFKSSENWDVYCKLYYSTFYWQPVRHFNSFDTLIHTCIQNNDLVLRLNCGGCSLMVQMWLRLYVKFHYVILNCHVSLRTHTHTIYNVLTLTTHNQITVGYSKLSWASFTFACLTPRESGSYKTMSYFPPFFLFLPHSSKIYLFLFFFFF